MGNEIWRDIPGYEGIYQVSNMGSVKFLRKEMLYGIGKKRSYNERIIKPETQVVPGSGKKFLSVRLRRDGRTKYFSIKRLVANAFLDAKPRASIGYKNGNYLDCRAENLVFLTYTRPQTPKEGKGQA